MKHQLKRMLSMVLCASLILGVAVFSTGCQNVTGKVTVELFQYKPEAVKTFDNIAQKFNAEHSDIHLVVSSPNDAVTVLKTRLIKDNPPDIIGIGGDINYSNFLDAGMLLNISDYKGLDSIKDAYKKMDKQLELVPQKGVYAMPYAANAAGILYNKKIFQQHGWTIPQTWDELIALCKKIKAAGITPFYYGMKDTWTTLAPWNAIAVDLVNPNICQQVNLGKATFKQAYSEVADKEKELLQYGQKDPFAYSYNDACTAFAKGQAAMFAIGNYAVPQITSVNPDIQLDSFVMPASNDASKNQLNSGNDLQFSVMKSTRHKEACYEVLDFLLKDETVQSYVNEQNAVPCKKGNFKMSSVLDSMQPYIQQGKMVDYQDHHYPSEMSVDALIQTFLLGQSKEVFLTKFDRNWKRYNEDTIAKLQAYEAEHKAAASSSVS